MSTSFGALCTDFYVNQRLALKMDLPQDRDTVLHLFDRVRAEFPEMTRFRRYRDELALESPRRERAYQWVGLREQSVRSGQVNPESMEQAYSLHRLLLELTPYFLSISPLDFDHLELLYGFDVECKANQHEVVAEALVGRSAIAALLEVPGARPVDVQPAISVSLGDGQTEASFRVEARTTASQVRNDRYRTEPVSIFLSMRRIGPLAKVEQLGTMFDQLRADGERLVEDKLIPNLLRPINEAIIGSA
jgi:hypothetical protein